MTPYEDSTMARRSQACPALWSAARTASTRSGRSGTPGGGGPSVGSGESETYVMGASSKFREFCGPYGAHRLSSPAGVSAPAERGPLGQGATVGRQVFQDQVDGLDRLRGA